MQPVTTAEDPNYGLGEQPPSTPHYVVRMGHKPGVYTDRNMAVLMLTNYPDSNAKEFMYEQEAEAYMKTPLGGGLHTVDGLGNPIRVLYTSGVCDTATAELAAVYQALRIVWNRRDYPKWEIRTDSVYVLECLTVYLEEWKRNGWKTSAGVPVENQEYILAIDKLLKKLAYMGVFFQFQLVGSNGDRWVSAVNQLAKRGIEEPEFIMPESEKESRSRRSSA
ncbi:Ribonuclease HI [Yarrowia sp. B02]|nr:Ribonuclease HI [Yarrowia sp. B02]